MFARNTSREALLLSEETPQLGFLSRGFSRAALADSVRSCSGSPPTFATLGILCFPAAVDAMSAGFTQPSSFGNDPETRCVCMWWTDTFFEFYNNV